MPGCAVPRVTRLPLACTPDTPSSACVVCSWRRSRLSSPTRRERRGQQLRPALGPSAGPTKARACRRRRRNGPARRSSSRRASRRGAYASAQAPGWRTPRGPGTLHGRRPPWPPWLLRPQRRSARPHNPSACMQSERPPIGSIAQAQPQVMATRAPRLAKRASAPGRARRAPGERIGRRRAQASAGQMLSAEASLRPPPRLLDPSPRRLRDRSR